MKQSINQTMKMNPIKRLIMIVLLITTIHCGNSGQSTNEEDQSNLNSDNGNTSNTTDSNLASLLPTISDFMLNQSDTFIVDTSLLGTEVEGVMPMPGSNSGCYHPGAHVDFTIPSSGTSTVDVYSPVDGVVTSVQDCYEGVNDQYKIFIAYAKSGDDVFELLFGFEPMAGSKCQDNPTEFTQYIFVEEGETVTKGQKIAEMISYSSDTVGSHIHFNTGFNNNFVCPDIFKQSVVNTLDDHYIDSASSCRGQSFIDIAQETLCYQPSLNESHSDYM